MSKEQLGPIVKDIRFWLALTSFIVLVILMIKNYPM
jgi:hypothetical protein